MRDDLFNELLGSIREAGRIRRGEKHPSDVTRIELPDVKALRTRFGMSQDRFAVMLGISRRTLEGWEQGRRRPTGPARRLLEVAAQFPEATYQTIFGRQTARQTNADRSITDVTTKVVQPVAMMGRMPTAAYRHTQSKAPGRHQRVEVVAHEKFSLEGASYGKETFHR